jgi:predicted Zn-dependent protease
MYAHSQLRAAAITAMAILSATACGGSRGTDRTAARDVPSPDLAAPPAATRIAPAAAPADDPNVSYATAESAYTAHHYSDAVMMFGNYAARHPQNVWAHYMRGVSAWKAGQLDTARSAFETALALDPGHTKSLINLSRVLLEQRRPGDALDRINVVLASDSTSGEAWRVLGRAQSNLGHQAEALSAYRSAIVLDSADVWSMNNMGLLLIGEGQYAEALGPLARAVQLDSGVSVFHNNLGIALERSGHMTAAASEYQEALNVDSSYAKAEVSLARVRERQDAPDAAPADITTLGTQFAAEITDWRAGHDTEAATTGCGNAPSGSTSSVETPAAGGGGSGGITQPPADTATPPKP